MRTEINETMSFEEGLNLFGLTLEDIANNLNLFRGMNNSKGPKDIPENSILLEESIKEYLGRVVSSQATLNTYSGELNRFYNFMTRIKRVKPIFLTDITQTDILLFLKVRTLRNNEKKVKSENLSVATYNKRLWILSAFFSFLKSESILQNSPTKGIRARKEGHPPIKFLTKYQQNRILQTALNNRKTGQRDFMILYLAMNTGLRLNELACLNINDVEFNKDYIDVKNGKGNKQRWACLTNEVKEKLIFYIKDYRKANFGSNIALFPTSQDMSKRLSRDAIEFPLSPYISKGFS